MQASSAAILATRGYVDDATNDVVTIDTPKVITNIVTREFVENLGISGGGESKTNVIQDVINKNVETNFLLSVQNSTNIVTNIVTKAYVENLGIKSAPNDYANVSNKAYTALQLDSIEDSVESSSTNKSLSAKMGKELQEQITNLKQRGRYLSIWDCIKGKPLTNPTVNPYYYKAGDYYIVGIVTNTVNYMPDGTNFVGSSSTKQEPSDKIKVNDTYYFDGENWTLISGEQKEISIAGVVGLSDALKGTNDFFRKDGPWQSVKPSTVNDIDNGIIKLAKSAGGVGIGSIRYYFAQRMPQRMSSVIPTNPQLGLMSSNEFSGVTSFIPFITSDSQKFLATMPDFSNNPLVGIGWAVDDDGNYYIAVSTSNDETRVSSLKSDGTPIATSNMVENISQFVGDERYLGKNNKALDSDKLDGHDASYFAQEVTGGYLPKSGGIISGITTIDSILKIGKEGSSPQIIQFGDGTSVAGSMTASKNAGNTIFSFNNTNISKTSNLTIDGSNILTEDTGDERYLGITSTASNSDKLDGHDSSYFATAVGGGYLKRSGDWMTGDLDLSHHRLDLGSVQVTNTGAEVSFVSKYETGNPRSVLKVDGSQVITETLGDTRYLGKTSTAVDSDKLDGHDSSYFATEDITNGLASIEYADKKIPYYNGDNLFLNNIMFRAVTNEIMLAKIPYSVGNNNYFKATPDSISVGSNAGATKGIAVGTNVSAGGLYSSSFGDWSRIFGDYSHALGSYIEGSKTLGYEKYIIMNVNPAYSRRNFYNPHGSYTFNLGVQGGLSGIYINEDKASDLIANVVTNLSYSKNESDNMYVSKTEVPTSIRLKNQNTEKVYCLKVLMKDDGSGKQEPTIELEESSL